MFNSSIHFSTANLPPTTLSSISLSLPTDAGGQLVLPGLIDAHLHVMLTGESAYYLDLQACTSIAQLQQMLASHMEAHPELPWVVGVNWDQVCLYYERKHKCYNSLSCTVLYLLYCTVLCDILCCVTPCCGVL